MVTHANKKFVLLAPDVYDSLLQKADEKTKSSILASPEKAALNSTETNMRNV